MDSTAAERGSAFGRQLRRWRRLRGMSQLSLATEAELSQRHLSFIETGRSRPGPQVIHRISEALSIPLRERNRLFESAGLAPAYPEKPMDDVAIAPFRDAVQRMLENHDPYPAYVVDRWWDLVDANRAGRMLFPQDVTQGVNLVDVFLGPGPMREMLDNFAEVAWAFLARLRLETLETGMNERMAAILERAENHLADVPAPAPDSSGSELVICPRLNIDGQIVRTLSMVARFGQAREVTVDELRVELVFPQDQAAERFFHALAASGAAN